MMFDAITKPSALSNTDGYRKAGVMTAMAVLVIVSAPLQWWTTGRMSAAILSLPMAADAALRRLSIEDGWSSRGHGWIKAAETLVVVVLVASIAAGTYNWWTGRDGLLFPILAVASLVVMLLSLRARPRPQRISNRR